MFQKVNYASIFTCDLFALLSICPDLWYVADTKETPCKWNLWEGWVLTTIQYICIQFDSIQVDSPSPFNNLTTLNEIFSKVNTFMTPYLDQYDRDDVASFYKSVILCFCRLFKERDYSTKLVVVQSIEKKSINGNQKIIIFVGDEIPKRGRQMIGTA